MEDVSSVLDKHSTFLIFRVDVKKVKARLARKWLSVVELHAEQCLKGTEVQEEEWNEDTCCLCPLTVPLYGLNCTSHKLWVKNLPSSLCLDNAESHLLLSWYTAYTLIFWLDAGDALKPCNKRYLIPVTLEIQEFYTWGREEGAGIFIIFNYTMQGKHLRKLL